MSFDPAATRAFLHDVRTRSEEILNTQEVDHEVKKLILDLLKISAHFESLIQHSSGQSADSSLLRKKFDQAKQETKNVQARVDSLKQLMAMMVPEVKTINSAAMNLSKTPGASGLPELKGALQKIVEIISRSTKL